MCSKTKYPQIMLVTDEAPEGGLAPELESEVGEGREASALDMSWLTDAAILRLQEDLRRPPARILEPSPPFSALRQTSGDKVSAADARRTQPSAEEFSTADARLRQPSAEKFSAGIEETLRRPVAPVGPAPSTLLTGVVEDTHHPDLPGRVYVAWHDDHSKTQRAWLSYLHGAQVRRGDRVLLGRPANESQWLVTGVVARGRAGTETSASISGSTRASASAPASTTLTEATAEGSSTDPDADAKVVRIEAEQRVRIEAHDGTPLFEISGSQGEVRLRVLSNDLDLAAAGRLRLSGRAVEIDAGVDGVGVRTEKDVVVRGRTIRLN